MEWIVAQQATIQRLEARVAAQEEVIATLTARMRELEVRLATDSHNRSRPPSTDGPQRKPHPQSLRGRSGRQADGQPGHPGQTLRLVEAPDEVQAHSPTGCRICGGSLAGAPATRRERRQVVDLPTVQPWVVEHQAATKTCPACGSETTGDFPTGVTAVVQYGPGVAAVAVYLNQAQLLPLERTSAVLAELFGCPVAEGTVERAVKEGSDPLAEVETVIKQGIQRAPVVHFDETGLKRGGRLAWRHVASTARLTFYAAHPQRGRVALDEIGLLPHFSGRAVHDGWATYWQDDRCAHALCNAHHLRELTFVAEQLGQAGAQEVQDLLREITRAVEAARAARAGGRAAAGVHYPLRRDPG